MPNSIPAGPFDFLEAFDTHAKAWNAVIETPRGHRNKFKYDRKRRLFLLNSVLPAGSAFPYDFGYIPGTLGQDGDPVDVLLLMDEPAFTGCVIQCRLIGVLEAEQREMNGTTERNDRLVAVAQDAHDYQNLHSLKDVDQNLLKELEYFFESYNRLKGKEFKMLAARGASAAKKLAQAGIELLAKSRKK